MNTMIVLIVADSLAPRSSSSMQAHDNDDRRDVEDPGRTHSGGNVVRSATVWALAQTGISSHPAARANSPGGAANSGGICRSKVDRNSFRYWPHPTATAATETPYSSIRHQPQSPTR